MLLYHQMGDNLWFIFIVRMAYFVCALIMLNYLCLNEDNLLVSTDVGLFKILKYKRPSNVYFSLFFNKYVCYIFSIFFQKTEIALWSEFVCKYTFKEQYFSFIFLLCIKNKKHWEINWLSRNFFCSIGRMFHVMFLKKDNNINKYGVKFYATYHLQI